MSYYPDKVRYEWKLAKDHRLHLHRIIDTYDLPVTTHDATNRQSIHARLGEDDCLIRARRGRTSKLAARVAVAEENDGGFLSE